MSRHFDLSSPADRARGLSAAAEDLTGGLLAVFPTDTTYAIGCDAFSRGALEDLRRARGSSRSAPPAVLVAHVRTLDGITMAGQDARTLAEAFWPGPLTLLCRAQPTLDWELGEAGGTVAVRMPLHPVTLELLEATGPLATSGANLAGGPAATSCQQARVQLGESVAVYLDAGPAGSGLPSTVVDATGLVPRVLRLGQLSLEELAGVVPQLADACAGESAG